MRDWKDKSKWPAPHFETSERYFETDGWRLALWDHSQYRGWVLYRNFSTKSTGTRQTKVRAEASVEWSPEQAIEWADKIITTECTGGITPPYETFEPATTG